MLDAIGKAILENPEKISIIFVLFILVLFAGKIILSQVKSKDALHDKNNQIHTDNAKALVSLNEKQMAGFDKIAVAIERQADSQTVLATQIEILRSK